MPFTSVTDSLLLSTEKYQHVGTQIVSCPVHGRNRSRAPESKSPLSAAGGSQTVRQLCTPWWRCLRCSRGTSAAPRPIHVCTSACGLSIPTHRPAFLVQGGLNQRVECLPIRGDGQTLETLIVITTCFGVFRNRNRFGVKQRRWIGVEADGVVTPRQECLWGLDGHFHTALSTELVHVWAALIRHPESAVSRVQCQVFASTDTLLPPLPTPPNPLPL